MRAPRHGPRRLPVRLPGPGRPERVLRVHEVYCAELAGGKEITNFRTVQVGSNRQTSARKRLSFSNAYPDCASAEGRETLEGQIIRLPLLESDAARGARQTVRRLAVSFVLPRAPRSWRSEDGCLPNIWWRGRTCWPASSNPARCLLRVGSTGFSPRDGARRNSNLRNDGCRA